MSVIISIAIFLVVLFVLILVHEWGHFIAAKKTGMRVDEFGIGFPPTLWSRQIGETNYKLNALPIGGYVKILGEDGESGELSLSDQSRTFTARPYWAQAIVLLAGVTMNIVLAWFLLFCIAIIGTTTAIDESIASESSALTVAGVLPSSPASILPVGAKITDVTSSNGAQLNVLLPSSFISFVSENSETSIRISYEYEEVNTTVDLLPVSGLIPDEPERAILGVQLALFDTVSYSFFGAITQATYQTVYFLKSIVVGVVTFFSGLFTGNAALSDVAGPVGIVGYVGEAATFGFTALLFFTAIISLNLAVINLLPIPALDGGRLVFVVIEAIMRRPINQSIAAKINTFGFLFLIMVMILVTISDIGKFF
jgi:regulator of sigma E protease